MYLLYIVASDIAGTLLDFYCCYAVSLSVWLYRTFNFSGRVLKMAECSKKQYFNYMTSNQMKKCDLINESVKRSINASLLFSTFIWKCLENENK